MMPLQKVYRCWSEAEQIFSIVEANRLCETGAGCFSRTVGHGAVLPPPLAIVLVSS